MRQACDNPPLTPPIQLNNRFVGNDEGTFWADEAISWRLGASGTTVPFSTVRTAIAALVDAGCTTPPVFEHGPAGPELRWERTGRLTYYSEWPVEGWRAAALMALRALAALKTQRLSLSDLQPFDIVMAGPKPILVNLRSLTEWSAVDEAASIETLERYLLRPMKCAMKGHARLARKLLRGASHGLSVDDEVVMVGKHKAEEVEYARDRIKWLEDGRPPQDRDSGRWARWTHYELSRDTKNPEDVTVKTTAVESVLTRLRPKSVLDIACNAGRYALPAAHTGAIVTGIDADEACMNTFFTRALASKVLATGLVMDMRDPSPTRGWGSGWSASLAQRLPSELVMMLAFLHHLVVKTRMSRTEVRQLLESLVQRWLLLEIAPHPFSEGLSSLRDIYTVEWVLDTLGPRFTTCERWEYGDRGRCLILLERS